MTIKNKQLLRDAIEFAHRTVEGQATRINGIPTLWDQASYARSEESLFDDEHPCGTAYCIAGYIVAQHPEYQIQIKPSQNYPDRFSMSETIAGKPFYWHEVIAARMLGIENVPTDEEYNDGHYDVSTSQEFNQLQRLFNGENQLTDVKRIAAELLAE